MNKRLDINPQTKIGELLEAYPQLEDVLLGFSPSFVKLKNPILRKTIGRIASLRQVAEVGGLNVGDMVSTLRKATGIDEGFPQDVNVVDIKKAVSPEWAATSKVTIVFDASPIIDSGKSPMNEILEKVQEIKNDEVMLLITPFKPVPIIELLGTKGYLSWSDQNENNVYTYLTNTQKSTD